jgi:2-polyprenyl-3-methyl-5-hydroxy-6-metoxy-1,4-benzoquinol methylase
MLNLILHNCATLTISLVQIIGKTKMKRTFDRVADVAKLFGCNTRNVEYRWTIFERHLQTIPTGVEVLDFGCGSLRESFELSSRGFRVTSFDIDADTLNAYLADYQWTGPKPQIVSSGSLSQFSGTRFSLVIAFDVFEHLGRPDITLADLASALASDGLIFCTVPNGRSLAEIVSRVVLKVGASMGHKFIPGVPHLQFRSTCQWRRLFEQSGFEVRDHEMAIGFFVNTWAAIVHYSSLHFFPLLVRSALRLPRSNDLHDPLGLLGGPRVMRFLNALDRRTPFLRQYYGWNLFVLRLASRLARGEAQGADSRARSA